MADYLPGALFEVAELNDSFSHTIAEESQAGSVTLKVPWSDRYTAANALVGLGHPNSAVLRCKSVVVRPWGGHTGVADGQQMTYEYAQLEVNYSAEKEEPETEDLVSESLEPTAEFAKMDYRRFRWESLAGDPLEESEAPGRLVHGLKLVRTLYNRSTIPASALTLGGHVNASPYSSTLLGLTFAAETLLFIPPKPSRTIKTDGTRAWTLQVSFEYKKDGWNKFWRAKEQEYQEILDAESGLAYKNYPTASFGDWLF